MPMAPATQYVVEALQNGLHPDEIIREVHNLFGQTMSPKRIYQIRYENAHDIKSARRITKSAPVVKAEPTPAVPKLSAVGTLAALKSLVATHGKEDVHKLIDML